MKVFRCRTFLKKKEFRFSWVRNLVFAFSLLGGLGVYAATDYHIQGSLGGDWKSCFSLG